MKKQNKFKNVFTPLLCFIVVGFVLLTTASPAFALPGRSHLYIYECPYETGSFADGTTEYRFNLMDTPEDGSMHVQTYNTESNDFHMDVGQLWDTFLFRDGYRHIVWYETPTFYIDQYIPFGGPGVVDGEWVFALPITMYSGDLRFEQPFVTFRFYDANGNSREAITVDLVRSPQYGDDANHYFLAEFNEWPLECLSCSFFNIEVGYSNVRTLDTSGYVEKSIGFSRFEYRVYLETGSLTDIMIKNELSNFEDQQQADQFGDRVDDFVGSMDSIGQVPEIDWDSFGVEDLVSSESFTNVNSFLAVFYESAVFDKVLLVLGVLILLSYIFYASKGR